MKKEPTKIECTGVTDVTVNEEGYLTGMKFHFRERKMTPDEITRERNYNAIQRAITAFHKRTGTQASAGSSRVTSKNVIVLSNAHGILGRYKMTVKPDGSFSVRFID